MVTFGTWNIDAVHRTADEVAHLPGLCARLIQHERIDFFVTTESGSQALQISRCLPPDGPYALVYADERFGLLASVDPAYVTEIRCPEEARSKTFAINLPGHRPVLLTMMHGLDARSARSGTQSLVFRHVVENVRWAERLAGHRRSIVLGDFNVNPYADAALASDGLHAVMGKREAARGSRAVAGRSAEMFYSPMFRLIDAADDQPPGTYYRGGSDTVEPLWHMLDQVVVRPELIAEFVSASLRIVDRVGDTALTTRAGRPDRRSASDHLPLVFEMDLRLPL